MSLKEVVTHTDAIMKKTVEAVLREFNEVRTGRAHPALVEELHVDYYGTPTPIKQMAAVSAPDASCLLIQPWDPSALPEIEKAISNSKLGGTPNNDGKMIRLIIPALSEERRKELAKIVKDMAEKGRVSLRSVRREANEKIAKLKKDNVISEDDNFKGQEEVQKLTDKHIKEIDVILEKKSKELMTI
ncbi:MAG: ribosome recycling factor [Candidatus Omnitrophica bacterium]|nr:ribosome recycling factor [Candidatus Omnitrophota bacterium]